MDDSLYNGGIYGVCEDPKNKPLTEQEMSQEDHQIDAEYDVNEERLGRGGCAVVYEGWRKADDFHVAIKVLAMPATADEQEARVNRKRFYREAKLIASLQEEHIVGCVDYGVYERDNNSPCMVLEFIKGQELGDYMKTTEHLSIGQSVSIVIQVLQGLAVAHEKTIIHRDIKPGNIMVLEESTEEAPRIKVLDFGIATVLEATDNSSTLMTQQGNIRGTPPYMAPELFTGAERASVESDLYAVGLVLLECLTNVVAFDGASFMQIAYKQVNEEAEIPTYIPECLANVIRKAIAKKKADRYHSAQEFIADLQANVDQAIAEYPKCAANYAKSSGKNYPSKFKAFWRHNKKNVILAAIIALVFIVITTTLVVVLTHRQPTKTIIVDDAETREALEAANAEKAKLSEEIEKARSENNRQLLEGARDYASEKLMSAWNRAVNATPEAFSDEVVENKPKSSIEALRKRKTAAAEPKPVEEEKPKPAEKTTKTTTPTKKKTSKSNSNGRKRDTMLMPTGLI